MYFEDAKPIAIEITSINYDLGQLNIVEQPPLAVLTVLLQNATSSPQQLTQSRTFQTTDTGTTTFSETTEVSVQMNFSSDFLVTNSGYTVGFKQGVTYSTGSSHSEQNTYTVQFQATVPPNSSVKGTCSVRQGTYDVPYEAIANVTYQDRPSPTTMTLHGILKGLATALGEAEYDPVPVPLPLGTFKDASGRVTVTVFSHQGSPAQAHWNEEEILVGDPDMIAIGGGGTGSDIPAGNLLTSSHPNDDLSGWVVSSKDHEVSSPVELATFVIGMKIAGMSKQDLKNSVFISQADSGVASSPRG